MYYDNGILINKERPLNPKISYTVRKEMKIKNEEFERKRMKNIRRSQAASFYKSSDGNTMLGGNSSDNEGETDKSSSNNKNTKDSNIYRSEDFIESYLNHKISDITKSFDLRETVI